MLLTFYSDLYTLATAGTVFRLHPRSQLRLDGSCSSVMAFDATLGDATRFVPFLACGPHQRSHAEDGASAGVITHARTRHANQALPRSSRLRLCRCTTR